MPSNTSEPHSEKPHPFLIFLSSKERESGSELSVDRGWNSTILLYFYFSFFESFSIHSKSDLLPFRDGIWNFIFKKMKKKSE